MTRRSSFVVALMTIMVVGAGVGAAQLGLRNDGIQFPDGTVQKSAAETPGVFVQASGTATILNTNDCATGTVYAVPAGKRLRIEWLSIEAAEGFPPATDFVPVDVDIKTWLADVQETHFLDRLESAVVVGPSFFGTARYATPITLYSQGNKSVDIRACRNDSTGETSVTVTIHGQLFDE